MEFKWATNQSKSDRKKKNNKTDTRKTNNMSISDTLATREFQINNNNNNNNKKKKKKNKTKNKEI